MSLLNGLRVLQLGSGLAAAVAGRLFADVGAMVAAPDADRSTPLARWLNDGKDTAPHAHPDLVVTDQAPDRAAYPRAAIIAITPFGLTGPDSANPGTDLTLFAASGMMKLLTGQVDDTSEPPLRAVGEQSAFLGGLAAACAGMHAVLADEPALVDVSLQEALATLAMTELTRAGQTGKGWQRKRVGDGNGSTVCILPATDGYAAISPREDRQWAAWLKAMGSPEWGDEPRFRTKPDRAANWDALHALMSAWSRQYDKQTIADIAQEAHVPSFPLREPGEQLASSQLAHRGYWRRSTDAAQAPGTPFGLTLHPVAPRPHAPARLPLQGVKVLDFSWVIAGPTTTRYLAAMGADVIKVEAPGRGDPGRASELHTVLGQAKRAIVLDLKKPEAVRVARDLAARCDILVENFATGVMDRLGLGAEDLRAVNPGLVYISASGLGRTGPEAQAVAYGTLLQSYAGFAGLNRHPGIPPRIGFAWADPMCALQLAFIAAAAIWRRARPDAVTARVDFSMIEAMLWTMAAPVLAAQTDTPPQPAGNRAEGMIPHDVYRCAGADEWLALAVANDAQWRALCGVVPALAPHAPLPWLLRRDAQRDIDATLAAWCAPQDAREAAATLVAAGVPASAVLGSLDLRDSPHLAARGFWDAAGPGVVPGLPWRASFGRANGPAPGLGEHTDAVLAQLLGLDDRAIAALRAGGALG